MRHVTIGTAGHVDHGKTALVKALTGVDTDRLPAERQRQLTIELGFAPLDLPSGTRVSLVDVPGHERFVRNMVAGVTGIDIAVLVVAADEGVMPQTREHLSILELVGVSTGVVAVTKADLVESEWMELVIGDISTQLLGTGLASAKIVPVSSVTGCGIEELVGELDRLAFRVAAEPVDQLFRLPVDRVFSIPGHGTVVTGTVAGGQIASETSVTILPAGLTARVRSLQVHGQVCSRAVAGDRCALNLAGIDQEQVRRGDSIVYPGQILAGELYDVTVRALPEGRGVQHGRRLRILSGTSDVFGHIRLLSGDCVPAGETGYGQLRLETPLAATAGDAFVLRELSPAVTVGGGRVLGGTGRVRKRRSQAELSALKVKESGDLCERVRLCFAESGAAGGTNGGRNTIPLPLSISRIAQEVAASSTVVEPVLADMEVAGDLIDLGSSGHYLLTSDLARVQDVIRREVASARRQSPWALGIDREELRSRCFPALGTRDYSRLLDLVLSRRTVRLLGTLLTTLSEDEAAELIATPTVNRVLGEFAKSGVEPLRLQDLEASTKDKEAALIVDLLVKLEKLVSVGEGSYVTQEVFCQAVALAQSLVRQLGALTTAGYRDALGTGRKAAIAFLETMDAMGITQRQGDVRVLGGASGKETVL